MTHGTYNRKQTDWVRVMMKRGDGTDYSKTPKLIVKYRDNGKKEWKAERELDLGAPGQNEYHKAMYYMGQYRSRQYSISFSESVDYRLVGIEEHVEALGG